MAEPLRSLLRDDDAEIRAQAARVIGDVSYAPAANALVPLLRDDSPRVQFFAAEALGRIGHAPAFQPIVDMIAASDGEDVYLRHAGSLALSRTAGGAAITALAAHPSSAVRTAAVVALRRQEHVGVNAFLDDSDEFVVTEAARAINDDGGIPAALTSLARILGETPFSNEPLVRRVLNANLRVGTADAARRVADYAAREDGPEAMRAEALAVLGVWPSPSPLDRVDGVYLGYEEREPRIARSVAEPLVAPVLERGSAAVKIAAAEMAARLDIASAIPHLYARLKEDNSSEVRIAMLDALEAMTPRNMEEIVRTALGDQEQGVRMRALGLIPTLQLSNAAKTDLLARGVDAETTEERQSAIAALGEMRSSEARDLLSDLLGRLEEEQLDPAIELDVLEAAEASSSDALQARVKAYRTLRDSSRGADDPLAGYVEALYGGNAQSGARIFFGHEAAQCGRCHVVQARGGDVGPDLTTIGSSLNAEELLEALVAPDTRIAPGYGAVSLTLNDGDVVTGILKEQSDEWIVVQTAGGESRRIEQANVADRRNAPSAMPPMGHVLSNRELRDVVAFLTTLTVDDVRQEVDDD